MPTACSAEQPTKSVGLIDFIRVRCHALERDCQRPPSQRPAPRCLGRVESDLGEAGHLQDAALPLNCPTRAHRRGPLPAFVRLKEIANDSAPEEHARR